MGLHGLENDTDFENKITDRTLMSHFINSLISDRGVGYLHIDKFIFIPNKFKENTQKHIELLFSDVFFVNDFKLFKMIDTGLEITNMKGKKERFVIDKTTDLYKKLKSIKHEI